MKPTNPPPTPSYIKATSWMSVVLLLWAINLKLIESNATSWATIAFFIVALVISVAASHTPRGTI